MIRSVIISAALLSASLAAPNAYASEATYTVEDFTGVNIARGVEATLTQGPFSVRAATDDAETLDDLYIAVDDGVLEVRRKSTFSAGGDDYIQYRVEIAAPILDFIKVTTGASLTGSGLDLADVEIDANTGASIALEGSCAAAEITADTGASVDAADLKCREVDAAARTGASVNAYASEKARGRARFGGSVDIGGDPKETDKGAMFGGAVSFND